MLSRLTKRNLEEDSSILMAVEAKHLNIFSPQLVPNRDLVNSNVSAYNTNMGSSVTPLLPFYQSLEAKTSVNTDSGVTHYLPAPRKRSRESMNQIYDSSNFTVAQKNNRMSRFGEEFLPQIQQYKVEIDSIISQHTKRIKMEVEERQKQQARLLLSLVGEGMANKLKEQDEQLQRMGKLNLALQERVRNLFVQNQLLRNLARTNEATANSLRTNLEHVLAQVGNEHVNSGGVGVGGGGGELEVEVESCCSNSDDSREMETGMVTERQQGGGGRWCQRCGERESCVLLLPCRHLCLCNICWSEITHIQSCPVCKSAMNATLHVNMSS